MKCEAGIKKHKQGDIKIQTEIKGITFCTIGIAKAVCVVVLTLSFHLFQLELLSTLTNVLQ